MHLLILALAAHAATYRSAHPLARQSCPTPQDPARQRATRTGAASEEGALQLEAGEAEGRQWGSVGPAQQQPLGLAATLMLALGSSLMLAVDVLAGPVLAGTVLLTSAVVQLSATGRRRNAKRRATIKR